jgi:hypothetical protein
MTRTKMADKVTDKQADKRNRLISEMTRVKALPSAFR